MADISWWLLLSPLWVPMAGLGCAFVASVVFYLAVDLRGDGD